MDNKSKNENISELLEAAKISHNVTVQQALKKLLFTVSIAHDKDYIERANDYHFHSGCSITVPRSADDTTMQIVWNNEKIGVRSMQHCPVEFRYGSIVEQHDPLPGVILIEENYK